MAISLLSGGVGTPQQPGWRIQERGRDVNYSSVRMDQVEVIRHYIASHEAVSTPTNMLQQRALRNGVQFVMHDGSSPDAANESTQIPLNKRTMAAVQTEWNDAVRKVFWHGKAYGFALVRRKPSARPDLAARNVNVPAVEDVNFYALGQRYVPGEGWVYRAFWRNLEPELAERMNIRDGDPIEDALVIVIYEPDEFGALTSPMARVSPLVMNMYSILRSLSYAMYHMARPTHAVAFDSAARQAGSADVAQPPLFRMTDFAHSRSTSAQQRQSELHRAVQVDAQQAMREQMSLQIAQLSEQLARMNSAFGGAYDAGAAVAGLEFAKEPPFLRQYSLTAGQSIESLPAPAVASNANETLNELRKAVWNELGVSPQLGSVEKANYAANSELAFGVFNDSVQNEQALLEPHAARMFEFVHDIELQELHAVLRGTGTGMANGQQQQQQQSSDNRHDDDDEREDDDGDGDYAEDDDDDDSETRHGKDKKKKQQGKRSQREDGAGRSRRRKRDAGEVITQHSAHLAGRSGGGSSAPAAMYRIAAKIRSTPITTYEQLRMLVVDGAIEHEDFKEHALNLVGLHQAYRSERKLKREDFLPPPPASSAKGKGGGGASKTKTSSKGGSSSK